MRRRYLKIKKEKKNKKSQLEDIKRMEEAHVKGKEHLKILGNCDLVRDLEQKIVDRKSTLAELNNE